MARSKTSKRWLNQHVNDPYVKKAQAEGYRSRAVYKLLEILDKDRLIHSGMVVVDLGAAPGGWSQVIRQKLGKSGRVIALDLLKIESIPGVEFLQGDFTEQAVYDKLLEQLGGDTVDLVFSDMAPNLSGNRAIDQPRAMYLAELALDFAEQVLKQGGGFLIKVFQGAEFDVFLSQLRKKFKKVVVRKPSASRPSSKEVYLLATGYT